MRKMGHEQDESPNPRAMCYNFQLGAHCQVCRHQLLHMCAAGGREGGHGGGRENQESDWGGQRLNTAGNQCFLLVSVVILHIFQRH